MNERQLRAALRCCDKPDERLLGSVKSHIYFTEVQRMRNPYFRRAIIIFAAVALLITTALAAWMLYSPADIAAEFGDDALSKAFGSDMAQNMNETKTSGGYKFTLLAFMSGEQLSGYAHTHNGTALTDRTYVAVAIQNEDGSPMPQEGYPDFYITPFLQGYEPWMYNAHTLNGSHTEKVVDGVLYRIVECDNVEEMASGEIYFAVYSGSFYSSDAIDYNADTGKIALKPDFDGAAALFVIK